MQNFGVHFQDVVGQATGYFDIIGGSGVTYNKWSLDQNSFEVLLPFNDDTDHTITIGDKISFRFTLTAHEDDIVDDVLLVEMSASYNGFSSLLFCGEPTVDADISALPRLWGTTYDPTYQDKMVG